MKVPGAYGKRTYLYMGILVFSIILVYTGCRQPAKRPDFQSEPTISLYVNETGETKKIKLEEYLEGVVAAEMDPSWSEEALAAQAILARTFTLKKIQEGGVKARGTDASTNIEEFQAYDPNRITQRVKEAVKRTRGEVVTYRGKLINGWFHADGGGQTAASAVEGLEYRKEQTPYIQSVKDPGRNITLPENRSWTISFPLAQVRKAVQEVAGQDPGTITRVEILERGPSGRTTKIRLGKVTLSAPALRLALGSDKMRSTLLESFTIKDGSLTMRGKGYGHGVGMSQWGARALAEEGKKAEEIVRYFFKGVQVEQRWR
ncbi:MAG TPA: SpoIID/LytB domain-containing protein [Clostridia bacterium]|jgi:stage II sporulation protein D|nr:SpoIID/LytB domain-containing protein [Clostridia bacterium]